MEKQLEGRQTITSKTSTAKSFLMFSITIFLLLLLAKSISASVADISGWRQLFNGKDLTGWK